MKKSSMDAALELSKKWWDERKLSYNWDNEKDVNFLAEFIDRQVSEAINQPKNKEK